MDIDNRILLVDDEPYILEAISKILTEENYSVISCSNANEAVVKVKENNIGVVLTDIKMPGISGLKLLEKIHELNSQLPVILMTGYADLDVAVDAIKKGAFDFILKPFHPEYIIHSVKKAVEHNNFLRLKENYRLYLEDIVNKRTEELETARKQIEIFSMDVVERLTTVAEFRDTEARAHVARVGIFSELISNKLGMPAEFVNNIKHASPLHDIGKIGIADYILFKLGALTEEEFKVIKTHTTQGGKILSGSSSSILQLAKSIALSHHERWDGTGYPGGLSGEDISIEGRIVMLVDQYDALRSERPYKPALKHSEVVRILTEGDGRTEPEHFDPDVLNAFITESVRFDEAFRTIKD